jgi:hypothetical protein
VRNYFCTHHVRLKSIWAMVAKNTINDETDKPNTTFNINLNENSKSCFLKIDNENTKEHAAASKAANKAIPSENNMLKVFMNSRGAAEG